MTRLRRLVDLIVTGGGTACVIGLMAFLLTSLCVPPTYIGPLCAAHGQSPGFDPWSGLPHGRSYISGGPTCVVGGPERLVVNPLPDDLVGRQAIPIPLGIVLGASIVLLFVALDRAKMRARVAA